MPRMPRLVYIVGAILVVGVVLTVLNVYELRAMQREHFDKAHVYPSVEGEGDSSHKKRPVYWVRAKNADSGYLDHVYNVLNRVGLVRGKEESNWDLLWHHDYPFLDSKVSHVIQNLQPHQKLNHIPGSGFYTSKVNLATSNISGIPPAFSLPNDREKFLGFSKQHPDKYWVQKSNKHRGIKITRVEDLDLGQENSFIQEYISNPLLIDGRKFDIGIYVIVTSVFPLRVYIYEGDALFRFCSEDYQPFDPKKVNKYVIGDDYTPMWEIQSLKKYYSDLNLNFKNSFNAYLVSLKKDPELIWSKMHETVTQVLSDKYPHFLPLLGKYKYPWNFFELSRFDFVVDENLNVYLMEANMSPNLSSGHFAQNRLLYEQVIFNLFSVVGVARRIHSDTLIYKSDEEKQMQASMKDIQVFPQYCASKECSTDCDLMKCKTCRRCLTPETAEILRRAHMEHLNRGETRRHIPRPFHNGGTLQSNSDVLESLASLPTEEDKLVAWWFRGKCLGSPSWCT